MFQVSANNIFESQQNKLNRFPLFKYIISSRFELQISIKKK